MENAIPEVIDLCRAAADKLEADANRSRTVIFPGWDYNNVSAEEIEQCEALRRAATAIVGTEDPHSGVTVTMGDVAHLIRYIADMLEE
jgi:hypothetical protein